MTCPNLTNPNPNATITLTELPPKSNGFLCGTCVTLPPNFVKFDSVVLRNTANNKQANMHTDADENITSFAEVIINRYNLQPMYLLYENAAWYEECREKLATKRERLTDNCRHQ